MEDEYLDDYWQYKSRKLIAKRNRLEKRLIHLFGIVFSIHAASIIGLFVIPLILVFTSISGLYIGGSLLVSFMICLFLIPVSSIFIKKLDRKINTLPTSKSLSSDELKVAYLNSLKRWDDE